MHRKNKSVFVFYRNGANQRGAEIIDKSEPVREIGRAMAKKVAKKLTLHLDV